MIEQEGFIGTLNKLMDATDGDVQATAKLFGSVEAQTAILSLCGSQADNLVTKTEAMQNASGAAADAFAVQTDTFEYKLQRMKNLGQNFLTSIGQRILPIVSDMAEKALPLVEQALDKVLPAITDIIETAGPGIANIADTVLPLVMQAIEALPGAIETIMPIVSEVFDLMGPAIENVAGFAIPLLVQGFRAIPKVIGFIKPFVMQIIGTFEKMQPAFASAFDALQPLFKNLQRAIEFIAPVATDFISQVIEYGAQLMQILAPIIAELSNAIMPILEDSLKPALDAVMKLIGTGLEITQKLMPVIKVVTSIIGFLISGAIELLSIAIQNTIAKFQKFYDKTNMMIDVYNEKSNVLHYGVPVWKIRKRISAIRECSRRTTT